MGVLILLNMAAIFLFSAEDAATSNETSGKVTQSIAQTIIKDFESKPQAEQNEIVAQMHPPLRKMAHMAEFGTLGALVFLFLLTWKKHALYKYAASLLFVALYAAGDEWHQMLSAGRGPSATDVLIDLFGALITCTLILPFAILMQKRKEHPPLKLTRVHFPNPAFPRMRVAVAADLHNQDPTLPLEKLRAEAPDLILIPGDLMEDAELENEQANGYAFLRAAASIAPTYYSLGNHEIGCYHKGNPWRHPTPVPLSDSARARIAATGVTLLDNECTEYAGLCICGITSGINKEKNEPDAAVLEVFAEKDSPRILLCHHPEYYFPYVQKTGIELTVCGHAHGGQWRFFGRGVYAPGQGIFPKYTAGIIDQKCVISRGLGNHTRIPRIANPPELVVIHCGCTKEEFENTFAKK